MCKLFPTCVLSRLSVSAGAMLLSSSVWAGLLIDTTLWTPDRAPSSGKISDADGWTQRASNTPTRPSNASGSLISDFSLVGNFEYAGSLSPIYDERRVGDGGLTTDCSQLTDPICNDNDILGIVFGWQDPENHYRLGFSQGGVDDITGKEGLFLIREIAGSSTTLKHWADTFWVDDEIYNFTIEAQGGELSVSLSGNISKTRGTQGAEREQPAEGSVAFGEFDFTLENAGLLDGRVGVYTESQSSMFSNLAVEGEAHQPVPAPATAPMLLLGLWCLRRRFTPPRKSAPLTR